MAVAAPRRRADGDEDGVGILHRGGKVGGEFEPSGGLVGGHQLVESRLVDRHLAFCEAGDLGGVVVDAGDVHPELGEAGARNEPDITGADHRNAHEFSPSARQNGGARRIFRHASMTAG